MLPAENVRQLLVLEDAILQGQYTVHPQMPQAGQCSFRVEGLYGDEEDIRLLDFLGVRRHGDRHGEVDQTCDRDPVFLKKGCTLAPCYEDNVCACAHQVRPNNGP
jgi:hypothetical protein